MSEAKLGRAQEIEAAIVSELDRQGCAYGGIDTEKLASAMVALDEQNAASGGGDLVTILRERASYLRAMIPEGLSTIERQSMRAMEDAANELVRLDEAIRTATVNLSRPDCGAHVPELLLHASRGGTVAEFVSRMQEHKMKPDCTINEAFSGIRHTLRCIERDECGK